jgi:hypothetical protein
LSQKFHQDKIGEMLEEFGEDFRDYTCECGARYRVHRHHCITREIDNASCSSCGRLIIEWNGGHFYTLKRLDTPSQAGNTENEPTPQP